MAETTPVVQPFLAGKRIIIAGAGLAGLTFAVSLRQQWKSLYSYTSESPNSTILMPPKIILYERNSKPASTDNDGYGLSIRSDPFSGGMQILRKLNLLESALRASLNGIGALPDDKSIESADGKNSSSNNSNGGSGSFNIWDKNWKTIMKIQPKISDPSIPVPAIRIHRKLLRQLLIDALAPEDIIEWGVSCIDATTITSADGTVQVQVNLSSGVKNKGTTEVTSATETCDLLIAADGAHSLLRNTLRPENKLSFAGAISISGHASFTSPSDLPAILRKDWGTIIGIGNGISLFAAPVDDHSAIWSLSYLARSERARGPARSGTGGVADGERGEADADSHGEDWREALRKEALALGHSIGEPFQTLVNASPTSTIWLLNARDLQPFPHTASTSTAPSPDANPPTERVIFIGDSNHAMSSFAGNGANMALMDGWDLAGELCRCVVSLPSSSLGESQEVVVAREGSEGEKQRQREALRQALSAYDRLSMPRSKKAIRISRWTIAIAHAEGWRLWVWMVVLRVVGWVVFSVKGGG